jgi:hypothetical protein
LLYLCFPQERQEKNGIIPIQILPKYIFSGCVMTDLSVQGFVDLSSTDLARWLSDEKEKMFGIQTVHAEERGGKVFFVNSFGNRCLAIPHLLDSLELVIVSSSRLSSVHLT